MRKGVRAAVVGSVFAVMVAAAMTEGGGHGVDAAGPIVAAVLRAGS